MSEVEKLYKNAGVESKAKCNSGACIVTNPSQTWCKQCESLDYTNPPFTAEKQLELIKWLARFNVRIEYESTEYTNAKYFIESHYHGYSVYIECFEQALAGFINILWQDLTEEEKQQVKGILK